ncbi:MAG: HAD domain-containing protein [Sphaerochaetaceae bacterium]|nr:HAD domain-containing protein [Sphaerochaetaceae bacterium]
MKLIFLDIDGVLNHELWARERLLRHQGEAESDYEYYRNFFDPNAIDLLNTIVEKTGAKVVVSSSWRTGRTVEQLRELLGVMDFKGEVIGKTPNLYFEKRKYPHGDGKEMHYNYSVPRGCEIKAWLEMNKSILGEKMSKVRYVILDDDSDMLYWQRENFFWVDPYCGLTPNIAYKVIQFLNK